MNAADVMKLIEEKGIKFVDYRFTDTRGKEQHVTVPISAMDEDVFEDGKMFDGSSIAGWKGIQESDMILMPDPATACIDPFFEEPTLLLTCDVIEPNTMPVSYTHLDVYKRQPLHHAQASGEPGGERLHRRRSHRDGGAGTQSDAGPSSD